MAQIGLKNLYYATITEDATTGVETYGTPALLAKAISAEFNITDDNATLYADDGADVVIRGFQSGTLTLGVNDLSTAALAALTGATVDKNGILVSAAENMSKPVAIGFQSKSAKGGDRYFWFYRVTFAAPSGTLNTKGETVSFETPSIEGTISRRNKADAFNNHPWKAEVKAGETGVDATTITSWFTTVYEPEAPSQ